MKRKVDPINPKFLTQDATAKGVVNRKLKRAKQKQQRASRKANRK